MYIAIDIGGTKTALASFRNLDPQYKINETVFPTKQNYNQALENIITSVHKLSENQKITAIGIAVPARITDKDTIGLQSNIPEYVGKNPAKDLKKVFNTQIRMHNDAVCAALAEFTYGAGKDAQRLLHIIMGTGTGGAFITNTNHGIVSIPLEPGYMVIDTKNSWGSLVSSKHIEKQLKTSLKTVSDDHLIWKDVANFLSLGIYNLSVLLNPQIITFSGGLINKRQFLLEETRGLLAKFTDTLPTPPPLVISTLSGKDSLLGALTLCQPTSSLV